MVARVSHWTEARWAQPVHEGTGSRAMTMIALVQQLADFAAAAEHRPPHRVPRLDSDLALPDQLRVMVADLVHSPAPEAVLREAAALIAETNRAL